MLKDLSISLSRSRCSLAQANDAKKSRPIRDEIVKTEAYISFQNNANLMFPWQVNLEDSFLVMSNHLVHVDFHWKTHITVEFLKFTFAMGHA